MRLLILLLGPLIMFLGSLGFVSLMWYLDGKRIDREIKKKYPNWNPSDWGK